MQISFLMNISERQLQILDNGGARTKCDRRRKAVRNYHPEKRYGSERRKGSDRRSSVGRKREQKHGAIERRDVFRKCC